MGNAPMYLQDLLQECEGRQRNLRSNMKHKQLKIPYTKKKTFAARSFSVLGPTWWNELPNDLKELENTGNFMKETQNSPLQRSILLNTYISVFSNMVLTG